MGSLFFRPVPSLAQFGKYSLRWLLRIHLYRRPNLNRMLVPSHVRMFFPNISKRINKKIVKNQHGKLKVILSFFFLAMFCGVNLVPRGKIKGQHSGAKMSEQLETLS